MSGGPSEQPAGSDRRRRGLLLLTCCLALFISTLDNTVANVALPSIGRELHAGTSALQWVIDAYVVVRGCLLLSAGALGDRFGRRRLFQSGLVVFGIGSLLCSVAPTVEVLIAARVVQALGGCFLVPSSLALITEAYPNRRARAQAIGIWSATTGISTGLGPPVGGLLVQYLGWRSVFWINPPIVLVAILLAARYAPASKQTAWRRLDLPGQVLVFVVLISLTSGFIESSSGQWTSPLVLTLFGIAAVSLGAFVLVETRTRDALLEPHLFRNAPFSGAALIATLYFVIYTGFLFVNTLFLQEIRGFSPLTAGLLVMPTTIGTVFLAPLSGRLVATRGPRLPVTIAGCTILAGCLLLSGIARTAPIWQLVAAYALIGSGSGLVNAPITNAAVSGLPASRAGVAGAVTSTFRQVGSALGVALLGSLTFSGFLSALPQHVDRLHISGAAAQRVVDEGRSASQSGGLAAMHGTTPAVAGAIGDAFVAGLHEAYLVAAGCAVLVIITALTLFRPRPPAQPQPARPPEHAPEGSR
ncbi:MAG: MFS transporter [Candidatus Dormiibacterota bacterium]